MRRRTATSAVLWQHFKKKYYSLHGKAQALILCVHIDPISWSCLDCSGTQYVNLNSYICFTSGVQALNLGCFCFPRLGLSQDWLPGLRGRAWGGTGDHQGAGLTTCVVSALWNPWSTGGSAGLRKWPQLKSRFCFKNRVRVFLGLCKTEQGKSYWLFALPMSWKNLLPCAKLL